MSVKPVAGTKAALTQKRILDEALRLFRERGFDETTMRDIAAAAEVANGAAYYYFKSKDDLAMGFYRRLAEESRQLIPVEINRTKDLRKRLNFIVTQKLDQFTEHRSFVGSLFRTAVDPDSPLSPFGEQTREIREEAIDWFRLALKDSNVTVPREFHESLPKLLWLYQMGTVLFWIYDNSPEQQRTKRLVSGTLDLIVQGLKLSSLPLLGGVRRRVAAIARDLDLEMTQS